MLNNQNNKQTFLELLINMIKISDTEYFSNDRTIRFLNMDCNEFMKGLKENEFDLNLSDPPYAIGYDESTKARKGGRINKINSNPEKKWDEFRITIDLFNEIKRTSNNSIIWGYNHLADLLGKCSNFIFWYKHQPVSNFADGELAYTTFSGVAKCLDYMYYGNINSDEIRIHPTQKPVHLYRWIIQNYTKPTDTILDCFGGSMSNAIACHMERRKLTIIELDADYFNSALKRFDLYERQTKLF